MNLIFYSKQKNKYNWGSEMVTIVENNRLCPEGTLERGRSRHVLRLLKQYSS